MLDDGRAQHIECKGQGWIIDNNLQPELQGRECSPAFTEGPQHHRWQVSVELIHFTWCQETAEGATLMQAAADYYITLLPGALQVVFRESWGELLTTKFKASETLVATICMGWPSAVPVICPVLFCFWTTYTWVIFHIARQTPIL